MFSGWLTALEVAGSNSHEDRTSPHDQCSPSAKAFGGLPSLVHTKLNLPKWRETMSSFFLRSSVLWSLQCVWNSWRSIFILIWRHEHSTCMHTYLWEQDSTTRFKKKTPPIIPLFQGYFYRIMGTMLPEFWRKRSLSQKGLWVSTDCLGLFLSLELQLRYNSLTEFTRKWSHTKRMRQYILAVPGSSCAWCPLCPRLSSANTFLPPYLFCWSQCELGSAVQTHSKSWLSTLVHSHLLPPFWWLLEGHMTTLET